jgi:hypothetical protein
MILRVHVDVPLADCKLLRLLGGQRRLSPYRRLNRTALGTEPDHRRTVLATGDQVAVAGSLFSMPRCED